MDLARTFSMCGVDNSRQIFRLVVLMATFLLTSFAAFGQEPSKQTWITFCPSGAEFSVELPSQPEHEILTLGSKHGTVLHDVYTATDAGFIFTIDRAELPIDVISDSTTEERLEQIQDALLKDIGATNTSENRFELNGYSGREIRFRLPGGGGRMRLLLVGRILYQVLATRLDALSQSEDAIKRFVQSFKLLRRGSQPAIGFNRNQYTQTFESHV